MDEATCPGCRKRDKIIARLQERLATQAQRVRTLEEQLGTNASNSSLPPSANPPQTPKPLVKQPSGKKPDAQPGHPPTLQQRLPPTRLHSIIPFVPAACRRCGHLLSQQAQAHDPEPSWHQVAELLHLAAQVTESQGHARTCAAAASRRGARVERCWPGSRRCGRLPLWKGWSQPTIMRSVYCVAPYCGGRVVWGVAVKAVAVSWSVC
jgi:hypothetical protein